MNTLILYDMFMTQELWNLKAKRIMKGVVTMQQMADRLHITKGAVSLKLNGKRETSLDEIREIAKMLGITFTELVESDPRVAVNQKEKECIDAFRSIASEDQQKILLMMKALKEIE